jgi:peptidoglycan hydrolase FlgJ
VTAPVAPTLAPAGGISTDSSRTSSRANLEKAGKQFEAVFDGMMLKSMRQAKLADGLFDSSAEDTFRDMQDSKVAASMAEHAPIGIGKAMVDFLSKNQPALKDGGAAPAAGAPAAATDKAAS